jgi:hypothetical protein
MIRTPSVFGLSLARQTSRRRLLAVTYLVLLILSVVSVVLFPVVHNWGWVLPFTCSFATWEFLRRMVEGTILPEWRPGQLIGLGLVRLPRSGDVPDEREVSVRNAACFQAYRVLALYAIALWLVLPGLFSLSSSMALRVLEELLVPLLAVALTLPYAVILWTEPDIPTEAPV